MEGGKGKKIAEEGRRKGRKEGRRLKGWEKGG